LEESEQEKLINEKHQVSQVLQLIKEVKTKPQKEVPQST
jgi:hypothetical protein